MTAAAQEFVTTLSVGALAADHVFTDLFDRNDEHDVGHIRLSREADLVVGAGHRRPDGEARQRPRQ